MTCSWPAIHHPSIADSPYADGATMQCWLHPPLVLAVGFGYVVADCSTSQWQQEDTGNVIRAERHLCSCWRSSCHCWAVLHCVYAVLLTLVDCPLHLSCFALRSKCMTF